jgi:protein-disulfide isomerase
LVQYGDYECPYCRALHPVLSELLQRTEGLRFVYRHFPLGRFHPNAARAAEAAEAAGAEGRFWEMHDALFADQHPLEDDRLTRAAHKAGLDLDRYLREMADGVYDARIEEAYKSALYEGVTGTPTLYLNGLLLTGVLDLEGLLDAVTTAGAILRSNPQERLAWLGRLKQFRVGKTHHGGSS